MVERPLGESFGPVMDALAHDTSRRLRTIHLNIPGEGVAKILWALVSLPHIAAACIVVDTDASPVEEIVRPGSAAENQPGAARHLQQVSLRGYVGTLLGQLGGLRLPSLRSFSIDSSTGAQDPVEFLARHGSNLALLDLNLKNPADVPLILDLCPNLHTFTFNADWRIPSRNSLSSHIVNQPHQHITTVGLHGLSYAFGVGTRYLQSTTVHHSLEANYAARCNDLNFAALDICNFPKLHRIRAVNRCMLEDLNTSNGPSMESGGYGRWSRWRSMCERYGIRLEDCTGQLLGTLPQNNDGGEGSDGESGDSVEGSDEDGDIFPHENNI